MTRHLNARMAARMRRRELVIRVRFEPSRTASSQVRAAFEMVLPVRRQMLRAPAREPQLVPVAELVREKKAR
ncbi:MAG: hypothetical protein IT285_08315 [Bdellovibrionales bacterium]|nr:hypothetical protein [Bdellovibrionales bacterium]